MGTQREVTLGGRVFVAADAEDMTFDQYAWVQQAADKAGLGQELVDRFTPVMEKALETGEGLDEDEAEKLTNAIISRCLRERAHLDVLAGMLTPKGEDWSWEGAEETKAFLGKMKGKANIETAHALLAEAVVGFFWSGLDSMVSSLKSSDLAEAVEMVRRESESGQESDLVTSES